MILVSGFLDQLIINLLFSVFVEFGQKVNKYICCHMINVSNDSRDDNRCCVINLLISLWYCILVGLLFFWNKVSNTWTKQNECNLHFLNRFISVTQFISHLFTFFIVLFETYSSKITKIASDFASVFHITWAWLKCCIHL